MVVVSVGRWKACGWNKVAEEMVCCTSRSLVYAVRLL